MGTSQVSAHIPFMQCLSYPCTQKEGQQGMVLWAGIFHFIKMKVFTGCISCPAVISLHENHFLHLMKLFSFTENRGRKRYYNVQNPLFAEWASFSPESLPSKHLG